MKRALLTQGTTAGLALPGMGDWLKLGSNFFDRFSGLVPLTREAIDS